MPPKTKKSKTTKVEKVKAVARTKRGSAQAQTTNVIVKVGETKKPARRRPRRPKGVPATQPPTDGWYPPQNLTRNGATFASEIRYVNVPTPAQTSFIAGGATIPQTFVPPLENEMMSGYETSFAPEGESGFNVTEFLQQAREKPKERMSYFYEGDDDAQENEAESFVPAVPSAPTFSFPVQEQPSFLNISHKGTGVSQQQPDIQPPAAKKKKETNRVALLNEVKGIIGELEQEGVISKRGESKNSFLQDIFGEFGPYKGAVKDYSEFQLGVAREKLRNRYNR
jgi:hypothetical protein